MGLLIFTEMREMMKRDRSQSMVIRGDRILLVEHELFGRDFYNLPGGGMEEGETPEQAALELMRIAAAV